MTRPSRLRSAPAALALLALACGGGDRPARRSDAPGRPVVIAVSSDLGGVNPLLSAGRGTLDILNHVFLRLFAEQPDFADGPPTFEPRLAESWSWSGDGRVLTLELRRDAAWSDGVPVTAEDVVWSFDAAGDPEVAWSHAESRERIEGYRALGEHTVEVRFRNAYPGRLSDVNECPILPRHVWGRVPFAEWRQSAGWFRENLVASGPFVLARWRPNQLFVLERNPRYHRAGHPKLDRIVFRVEPERANRLELLLSGEVDFVSGIRPSAAARVEASELAGVKAYWHRQYHHIVWNGCSPPLDDPEVRRGLTLALDRESLVEAVYGEYGRVAVSPILSNTWAFADLEPWPWDPQEARRLLAARGFRDRDGDGFLDRDGERLAVTLITNVENGMRVDLATLAHSQLGEIGVDAALDFREFSVLLANLDAHDFDAALSSWTIDTSLDLKNIFHSSSVDGGQNHGCYRNPEVDRLIDLARSQTDLAEIKRHLVAIQEIIHRDQPYTFLAEVQRLDGVARRLRGVEPNPLAKYGALEDWSVAPPG